MFRKQNTVMYMEYDKVEEGAYFDSTEFKDTTQLYKLMTGSRWRILSSSNLLHRQGLNEGMDEIDRVIRELEKRLEETSNAIIECE